MKPMQAFICHAIWYFLLEARVSFDLAIGLHIFRLHCLEERISTLEGLPKWTSPTAPIIHAILLVYDLSRGRVEPPTRALANG